MKTLAANANNDLFIDASGNVAIIDGILALRQCCITAAQTVLGEPRYAADTGTPYFETVWNAYNPNAFQVALREVLLSVPGVTDVTSIELYRTGDMLDYVAEIQTIFGPTNVNTI